MPYLKLLRPEQWIKNLLVFIPLFFTRGIFVESKFLSAVFVFIIFCIITGVVYIFNDLIDKKNDKKHSEKKNRPIASGSISSIGAIILMLALLVLGLGLAAYQLPQIVWLILFYILLNIIYSVYLKHIPILDILLVSSFYLLRIEVGGFATDTIISRWLILCVIFASLLLVTGKRNAEFKHEYTRPVLSQYNEPFLNQLLTLFAGLTIVSYGLYSVLGANSDLAIYSVFLVILGIIRYLFLVRDSLEIEYPEKLVVKDRIILISLIAWLIYMFIIFYK